MRAPGDGPTMALSAARSVCATHSRRFHYGRQPTRVGAKQMGTSTAMMQRRYELWIDRWNKWRQTNRLDAAISALTSRFCPQAVRRQPVPNEKLQDQRLCVSRLVGAIGLEPTTPTMSNCFGHFFTQVNPASRTSLKLNLRCFFNELRVKCCFTELHPIALKFTGILTPA
jgi:hypothetical protein